MVTLKYYLPRLVFIGCLFMLSPAYAGTQSLVTYYPAPDGNYNRVSVDTLQSIPNTLTAIQAQFKCSYDPLTGWPPCPAGIQFYNTDAHALYVSDGTHWRSVNATCIPITPCATTSNCGTDDCGVACGICPSPSTCNIQPMGTQGRCS